jgi:hypothetical protein
LAVPSHAPGPDPGSPPALSRRRVLAGGSRGLLALALIGTAVSACGSTGSSGPDPLEAELSAARADSELAAAAAKSAPPGIAPALIELSAVRARHATALVEELSRAAGKPTPTSSAAATPSSAAPAAPAPRPQDVIAALRRSGENAAKLAPTLSGYRAGLLGSIAAACTTASTIGLAPAGSPR